MQWLARIAAPFVWLLNTSSNLVMRAIGIRHRGEHGISADELHMIFAEATRTGVIEEQERAIMSGIMRLAERPVRELMTPRIELDWIDRSRQATSRDARDYRRRARIRCCRWVKARPTGCSASSRCAMRWPCRSPAEPIALDALIRKAEVVPDQLDAMDALRVLQQSGAGMAMVHDEYGHLEGIITPADLLKAIAGSFASHRDEGDEPDLHRARRWLAADRRRACRPTCWPRSLSLDLPEDREFATAAGYVLWVLKKLPTEGELFEEQGWRFEVVDMDGRRIDKLLVSEV